MTLLTQASLFFGVGFLETFISTQRTFWITQNRSKAASVLVFFESTLYFFVLFRFLEDMGGNWWIILTYALGNAIGTYINLEKVPF